ncbi:protein kinase domain-containing protein [Rubrivirga sp. IMCC45206]|uniref:protein kinase domain-containing protein n=1 Tax=Rubrivirga sp. IMCC45206 TaxID=3391614 RepID=UPI0039902284
MADADARWTRIQTLFEQARQRPADERTAWLRSVCGDDPEVYGHVAAMLDGADHEHGLFGARAIDLVSAEAVERDLVPSHTGERVGPWVLAERIGAGGMGDVYRAARADADAPGGFEQAAALKLVKRGMDSEAVLRRFETERQILARLQHPGIAGLLGGGLTDGGRPYFAMELVEGEPITDYCDARRLGVEARLALFADVCEAVRYAHRALVVHRDLKPSNILVADDGPGGRPAVKLLDFGIARVLSDDDGGDLTRTGQRVFTPSYAAPEQIRGEAPTTATDVFALGGLLYRLLSGARPVPTEGRTPAQVERDVLEAVPPAPSAAVTDPAARQRGTTADALARRLRGDLDVICLTALRKEPEHRYGGAAELLADVERHLAGQPVEARPATRAYRVRKFVGRHRAAVAGAAVALAAVVGGAGAALWQAAEARDQRDRAEAEAATAEQTASFLAGLFEGARPADGPELTASELLAVGASEIGDDLADQPATQADLYVVMGSVYRALAAFDSSEAYLGRALSLRRTLGDSLGVADAQTQLATTARRAGDAERAVALHRQAVAILREAGEPQRGLLGHALASLGAALHDLDRYDEAEAAYREGGDLLAEFPDHADDYDTALGNLAGMLNTRGDYEQAVEVERRVIASRIRQHGEISTPVAIAVGRYAVTLHDLGDLDAAERAYRRSLDIDRRVLGDDHPDLAYGLTNLGILLFDRSDYGAAEEVY